MKYKRYLIWVLMIPLLFSSCTEQPPVQLLNAENITGYKYTETYSVDTQPPPPETIDFTQQIFQTEITDISSGVTDSETEKSETTSKVASSDTSPVTSAPESSITTTVSVLTTTAVTTSIITPATTTAPAVTTKPVTTTTTPPSTTATTTTKTVTPAQNDYTPINYSKVMGVWISYLELQTAFAGKTEQSFRASFAKMMDNCLLLGINTVYVHLRAFGDSFYESDLFPWSKYASGTVGVSPGFDPLGIMLEEAHARSISFHGWINPMRINADSDISKVSKSFPVGNWYNGSQKGAYIVKSGDFWYLNPAYAEVRKLISDGAAEIVSKYDVDGLHIDDYFYPTSDKSFDSAVFSASGQSSLSDFRLSNCSLMVKSVYDTVKGVNSSLLFGISPQGNISNCYNIYADVQKWASQAGYCDYIAPQIYYGFENSTMPFDDCLIEWQNLVKNSGVKLLTGLAVFKIGSVDNWAGEGKNEWINSDDILKNQIDYAESVSLCNGVVFFSYRYMFDASYRTAAISAQLANAGLG